MKDVETIDLNCTTPNCPSIYDFIGDDTLYVYSKPENIFLISFYVPLIMFSLICNILAMIVVNRYQCLRSVTNYFLVNLSVADLLVTLICMPMAIGQATYSLWVYGDIMCKLSTYLQGVTVSAGVFTITAMSLDRYMAIRHPMSRNVITKKRAITAIAIIWFSAFAIFSPILFIRKKKGFALPGMWKLENSFIALNILYQRSFGIFCFVFVYAIPGCIVVVAYSLIGLRLSSQQLMPEYSLTHRPSIGGRCYNKNPRINQNDSVTSTPWQLYSAEERTIRDRRRLARVLLVLALVFAFCWLPYSVLSLILDICTKTEFEDKRNADGNDESEKLISIVTGLLPYSLLLGHINSLINPLLYFVLSKDFRKSIADLIWNPCRALLSQQTWKIPIRFRRDPNPSPEPRGQENIEPESAICHVAENVSLDFPTNCLCPANPNNSAYAEVICHKKLSSFVSSSSCSSSKSTDSCSSTNDSIPTHPHQYLQNSIVTTNCGMLNVQIVSNFKSNCSAYCSLCNSTNYERKNPSQLSCETCSSYNQIRRNTLKKLDAVKLDFRDIFKPTVCHNWLKPARLRNLPTLTCGHPSTLKCRTVKMDNANTLNIISEESEVQNQTQS